MQVAAVQSIGINLGEDSVLGFHLVGILAFSLSTHSFFFLATLVLSGFDPLVSVSQGFIPFQVMLEAQLRAASIESKIAPFQ